MDKSILANGPKPPRMRGLELTDSTDPDRIFWQAIGKFVEHLEYQAKERWSVWARNQDGRYALEVIGGLLARQATLAGQLALNPPIWNDHIAPLVLRSMVENCISLAWILNDPEKRSMDFVAYGLGQENLLLEQTKADLRDEGQQPEDLPEIQQWENWLDAQRARFMTEIHVGSWGPNLRKKAEEVGLLYLHRNDYSKWSGATHSLWHHIARFNLTMCNNPLHGFHRLPSTPEVVPDAELLLQAAEYVDLTLDCFDQATGVSLAIPGAVEVLGRELQKLGLD